MQLSDRQNIAASGGFVRRALLALVSALGAVRIRRKERTLELCETLTLGDRRFVALIRCEGKRFLIGATPNSISLLDSLSGPGDGNALLPLQREEEEQR